MTSQLREQQRTGWVTRHYPEVLEQWPLLSDAARVAAQVLYGSGCQPGELIEIVHRQFYRRIGRRDEGASRRAFECLASVGVLRCVFTQRGRYGRTIYRLGDPVEAYHRAGTGLHEPDPQLLLPFALEAVQQTEDLGGGILRLYVGGQSNAAHAPHSPSVQSGACAALNSNAARAPLYQPSAGLAADETIDPMRQRASIEIMHSGECSARDGRAAQRHTDERISAPGRESGQAQHGSSSTGSPPSPETTVEPFRVPVSGVPPCGHQEPRTRNLNTPSPRTKIPSSSAHSAASNGSGFRARRTGGAEYTPDELLRIIEQRADEEANASERRLAGSVVEAVQAAVDPAAQAALFERLSMVWEQRITAAVGGAERVVGTAGDDLLKPRDARQLARLVVRQSAEHPDIVDAVEAILASIERKAENASALAAEGKQAFTRSPAAYLFVRCHKLAGLYGDRLRPARKPR